jgi:hypothetical protein
MTRTEKCIYCGNSFNPTKGEGDHILPVQLGEFRNDIRFRRICISCNNKIGRSEQQFLLCGPESFFRDLVNPKIPKKRQRGRSKVKASMGVPSPLSTIDHGDHRELVNRSKDNPTNVFPVDQIVIHDEKGEEYFVELFTGMRPEQLKSRIEKCGISKIDKTWLHCDEKRWSEFKQLLKKVWTKSEIQSLPETEAGMTHVKVRTALKVTDHYFRTLAKIAFHYYLVHSNRGFRGDEQCFGPIRDFIMNGGNDQPFFKQPGPKFVTPFGKISSGGVVTPNQWCHIIAADETDKVAVVYIQLFVGHGCVPQPHYIKLADINSTICVPRSTWVHVYLYDKSPSSDRYAGQVEQAQITRIQ